MNETQYLLKALGSGPYKKKSYESDLSKLPAKHQPKDKYAAAELAGVIGGSVGDWPGLQIGPGFDLQFYNPFSGPPKNEFGSPEEALSYSEGQGVGTLAAAVAPAKMLANKAGGKFLRMMSAGDVKGAGDDILRAKEWLDPTVKATPGPALYKEEAENLLQSSTKYLDDINAAGKAVTPALKAGNALATAKGVGGAVNGQLQAARDSVDNELVQIPSNVDEPFVAEDMSGGIRDDTMRPNVGAGVVNSLAGRRQLVPYEQKDSTWAKIIDSILPQYGQERRLANEGAHYRNQRMKEEFISPEDQMLMQERMADSAAGRAGGLQAQGANYQLRNQLAPTMSAATLEAMLGSGSDSINPRLLERMTRQDDPTQLLQMLLSGGLAGPGQVEAAAPIINVPKRN